MAENRSSLIPADNGSEELNNTEHGDPGRLFVGSLNPKTTTESLERYFSRFGVMTDVVVMRDLQTGQSRGFGFVSFCNLSSIYRVLNKRTHYLDGFKIDPQLSKPKNEHKVAENTLFLGGLPHSATEKDIQQYFELHGEVTEVVIKFETTRQRNRGFGFVSFECEDPVNRLIAQRYFKLHGKQVEIKKVEHRSLRRRQLGHHQYVAPPGGISRGYQPTYAPNERQGIVPNYQVWGGAQGHPGQICPSWYNYGATFRRSYTYGNQANTRYFNARRN